MLGLVRSEDNEWQWRPFDDAETALHAEIEDVIFGESMPDCVGQLEQRFPASDARLSRVHIQNHGRYIKDKWTNGQIVNVRSEDTQIYSGGDHLVALALAKDYGEISVTGMERGDTIEWAEEGCIVQGSDGRWGHINHIKYNPKGVARAKKAAATRLKNHPVACQDIARATWQLRSLVKKYITSLSYESPDGRYSRYSVCWTFLETLKYYSFVFGPHTYRKHDAFRTLKLLWKERAAQSRKAFWPKHETQYKCQEIMCNLMDFEIRIRNGPLITEESKWKVRGNFPEFEEYRQSVYSKVIKAREEEDKKRAKSSAKTRAKAKH